MYPLVCVDCRWCLPTPASKQGVYHCKATEKINLVTGESEYQFCSVMRLTDELCGPDGKLFSLNISDPEGEQHGE